MPDALETAGLLLVVGTVAGLAPVANPSLIPVWSASREDHLAIVGAHRFAWAMLNLGFGLATVATTAALAILAGAMAAIPVVAAGWPRPPLPTASAASCGPPSLRSAGAQPPRSPTSCGRAAHRARRDPARGRDRRAVRRVRPGDRGRLVALGLTLLLAGGIAAPVAAASVLVGVLAGAWLIATGDVIPATLYLPTLLLGVALLAGWT